jgi:hypothetical protein
MVYDRWAGQEILRELRMHPDDTPISVVENFRDRMDSYCCISKTDKARDIFASLYEMATNVLDYLIGGWQ